MPPKVTFLRAKTAKEKLSILTETLESLLLEGKRSQVLAPNEAALAFLDEHLWEYKPEAFLPHAIAQGPSKAPVVLSLKSDNLNQAAALINLLPTPLPKETADKFERIFELLDETTPEKTALARLKETAWSS